MRGPVAFIGDYPLGFKCNSSGFFSKISNNQKLKTMGTRHIIMVVADGQTRIAQYGQWDGYPEGQGLTVLQFLRKPEVQLPAFKKRVTELRWKTKEDDKILEHKQDWKYTHFHISRDCGGEILEMVMFGSVGEKRLAQGIQEKTNVEFVRDDRGFEKESLFCEFAYVVDLDKETFEVYRGYNKTPLEKTERFFQEQPDENGYYPVKHWATFQLNNLPTPEEFIRTFQEEEDE